MLGRIALPGGWMWSAWQPERGMNFNSYAFEREGGCIAVDPLPLDDAAMETLRGLGGVRTVVLTNRDHERGAASLRERFGARILAHAPEAPLFGVPVDGTFADGDEVFPGAYAIALRHGKTPGEAALHFPSERAALVGDALIGAPAGALSLLPDQKLEDVQRFVFTLRRLWALRLQTLLLCDGQPLFGGADEAIGRLLEGRAGAEINRINLDQVHYVFEDEHERYAVHDGEIGLLIGARKLGYRLAKLPPGKAFCPLHSHEADEEFFYVVAGRPSVRTLRGTLACRPGDFIAFPAGERGTHQLRNDSDEEAIVLLVGGEPEVEICYYPDSDKVGVYGRDMDRMLAGSPGLRYFDGE